ARVQGHAVALVPVLEALVLVGGEADRDALPGAAGLGAEGWEGDTEAPLRAVDPLDGPRGVEDVGGQAGPGGGGGPPDRGGPGGQPRLQHGLQEGILLLRW